MGLGIVNNKSYLTRKGGDKIFSEGYCRGGIIIRPMSL